MVDFDESDKMIKISVKVDKSNTCNRFNANISLFIYYTVNKEQNIAIKPVVSIWFIHFSTYFYLISIYLYML